MAPRKTPASRPRSTGVRDKRSPRPMAVPIHGRASPSLLRFTPSEPPCARRSKRSPGSSGSRTPASCEAGRPRRGPERPRSWGAADGPTRSGCSPTCSRTSRPIPSSPPPPRAAWACRGTGAPSSPSRRPSSGGLHRSRRRPPGPWAGSATRRPRDPSPTWASGRRLGSPRAPSPPSMPSPPHPPSGFPCARWRSAGPIRPSPGRPPRRRTSAAPTVRTAPSPRRSAGEARKGSRGWLRSPPSGFPPTG